MFKHIRINGESMFSCEYQPDDIYYYTHKRYYLHSQLGQALAAQAMRGRPLSTPF